jgi:hypothetical protein
VIATEFGAETPPRPARPSRDTKLKRSSEKECILFGVGFYWPLIGWGIGLGLLGFGVFGFGGGGPWGREWEDRKTRAVMEKERGG